MELRRGGAWLCLCRAGVVRVGDGCRGGGGEGRLLLGRCEGLLVRRDKVLCVLVWLGRRRWSVVLEGHGAEGWEGEIAVPVRNKFKRGDG